MTAITRMSKKLLQDFSDWLMARSEAPIRSTGGLPTPDRQAYPRVGQPEPSYRAFAHVPSYADSVRIGEPHQKRLVGDPLHLAPFVLASQLSYRFAPTTSHHDYTECTVRGTMIRPRGVALSYIPVLHSMRYIRIHTA